MLRKSARNGAWYTAAGLTQATGGPDGPGYPRVYHITEGFHAGRWTPAHAPASKRRRHARGQSPSRHENVKRTRVELKYQANQDSKTRVSSGTCVNSFVVFVPEYLS